MKKVCTITLLLVVAAFFFLTSCTSLKSEASMSSETSTNTEANFIDEPTDSTALLSEKILFEKFENELTNRGYDYQKDIQWASMIGAKEGIGYRLTTGGSAELYIYDKESEVYKETEKAQAIIYIDEGVKGDNAIVKNGAALLMIDLDNSKAKEIEEIFNSVVG